MTRNQWLNPGDQRSYTLLWSVWHYCEIYGICSKFEMEI